jgi:hypothetical protein
MKPFRIFVSLLLAFVGLSCTAGAQLTTGTIAGNVVDTTGAFIPNAVITVAGVQSGVKYTGTSSSGGVYRISNVLPGIYNVTTSAPGFQTMVQQNVAVQVSAISALNIEMKVGGQTELVTVNGDAPTVDTQSAVVSTTITNREVEELPLSLGGTGALRSPEAFVFLVPGVSGTASAAGGGSGVFAQRISGGQAMGQEVLLDGASVDRSEWHSEFDETAPSVDAIQEFTVQTSTIPAEYSRTAGGISTFVTKTGSNNFHGVAYDIFKNDALDANTWFNNGYIGQAIANGTDPAAARAQFKRGSDKKNDYGGTIGGPIRIPWLYNGQDKSFFFFSYEQFRQSSSGTSVSTLPTAAERNGDFSALLGAPLNKINPCDGTQILQGQIFDPSTTKVIGGVSCRTAFPGNIISPSSITNVAKNVITLLPTNINNQLTRNYAFSDAFPLTNTTWTLRGDQVLTSRQKLTLSYSHRLNSSQVGLRSLPYPLDPGHDRLTFNTNYARVLHTFTISPNLVNQLILGYNRYDSAARMPTATAGTAWSNQIGIGNVTGYDFPQISFIDPQGLSTVGSNINNDSLDNGYRINDDLTWVHARHSFEFGVNSSYQEYAPNNFANSQGAFNFSTNETAPTPNFGPNAGSAFASFLLGNVDSGNATDYASQPQWRSNFFSFYGQDTYKLTPSLVLVYGLNWSFEMPRRELHNRSSSFDPTLPNPGADGALGALAFASGNNRSFTTTYLKDFSPRVGFSWSPAQFHGTLAIRGGYGIYYDSLFYGDTGNRTQQGFKATPGFNAIDGFTAPFNVNNGFPQYQHAPFISPTTQNGQGVDYVAQSFNAPGNIQNWSLQVEQQLATDLLFSITYVGTKGTRLRSSLLSPNALQQPGLSLGTVLSEPITSADAQKAGVKIPFSTFESLYGSNNATVGQALRKFPQFQGIDSGDTLENLGMSNYNALELELQRRFHDGLNLLVSYTWSKTLTDADSLLPYFAQINAGGSVQDPYNRRGERSVSNEDTPHQFVVSYIYELPVGRGKKFLAKTPRPVSAAVSGWQVSGVQRYQSGQPVAFGCAVGVPALDNCTRFSFTGQPVVIGSGEKGSFNPFDPAHNTWLNKNAFVDPNVNRGPFIPWQFGNVPRVYGGARSQNYYDEAFALQKNSYFTQSVYLEFRAEAFNAFNRHVFNNTGDVQPTDNNFGQVFGTIDGPRNIQLSLKLHY